MIQEGVNFINVLCAHFCTKFWSQKLQTCVLGLIFFGAKILHKKHAHKMLMKLTQGLNIPSQDMTLNILPGVNFTNVLRTAFALVDPKGVKRYL